jgi:hypothetical protein
VGFAYGERVIRPGWDAGALDGMRVGGKQRLFASRLIYRHWSASTPTCGENMLFRKLRLDWRYAISELIIVVAGVLIALGADQWIRGRADFALEDRYLHDLAVDLQSDTVQLSAAIALASSRAELGHAVLRAIDGDTVLTPSDLVISLERQFYFAFPAYSRTTISDLRSTGNLRLIRSHDLKRELSEYYQMIERLEQWGNNWRFIQQDVERVMPELLPLRLREAVISPSAPAAGWNGT